MSGETPTSLFYSATDNDLAALIALVFRFEHDPDEPLSLKDVIDEPNEEGFIPLYLAVKNGHSKVVDFLIQKGADLTLLSGDYDEKRELGGISLLHCAVYYGRLDIARQLLEKKPSLIQLETDSPDQVFHERDGYLFNIYTPLGLAAKCGRLDFVKFFIEEQARPIDALSNTHFPIDESEYPMPEESLIWHENHVGVSPLSWAVHSGHTEIALYLISMGAGVNLSARDRADEDYSYQFFPGPGEPPLTTAVRKNQLELIQPLLDQGADPNISTLDIPGYERGCFDEINPLYLAIALGHDAIALKLIQDPRVDVNLVATWFIHSPNEESGPLLFAAIAFGRVEVFNALLNRADLDIHFKFDLTFGGGIYQTWSALRCAIFYFRCCARPDVLHEFFNTAKKAALQEMIPILIHCAPDLLDIPLEYRRLNLEGVFERERPVTTARELLQDSVFQPWLTQSLRWIGSSDFLHGIKTEVFRPEASQKTEREVKKPAVASAEGGVVVLDGPEDCSNKALLTDSRLCRMNRAFLMYSIISGQVTQFLSENLQPIEIEAVAATLES